MLKDHQDAYGHGVYDYFRGRGGFEVIEREDGFIATSQGPRAYLADYRDWPPAQRRAMNYVTGRVLDIGCGAGRVALYLQKKGFDVTGIDVSPLGIRVCRLRGLKKARVMSITEVSARLGRFDTLLMMGNNFGLFGNPKRARWLLRRFHGMTGERAGIIAESRNPYPRPGQTIDRRHLEYQRWNRQKGKMSGQLKIRARYKQYATPWFEYLIVSPKEMETILKGTGWRVREFIDAGDATYVAVIGKDHIKAR
jgi:hypothetical protein